jgi:hypothetical protein
MRDVGLPVERLLFEQPVRHAEADDNLGRQAVGRDQLATGLPEIGRSGSLDLDSRQARALRRRSSSVARRG